MTLDEAIKVFLDRGWITLEGGTYFDGDKWREAIMVISDYFQNEYKALEQKPCGDAISRQAVLDLAEWFDLNQQHFTVANLIDEVENMPSVTPQQRTDAEVLDKIRAEIDQYLFQNEFGSAYRKEVSQIIDKYKAESEDKE